tara:strand:+ start:270 stop:644 length:375 start_codon:yes stop_codon:yes gene_type:complete
VLLALPGLQVQQVQRDHRVQQEQMAQMVLMELLGLKDQQVQLVLQELRVLRAQQEQLVLTVQTELMVQLQRLLSAQLRLELLVAVQVSPIAVALLLLFLISQFPEGLRAPQVLKAQQAQTHLWQ